MPKKLRHLVRGACRELQAAWGELRYSPFAWRTRFDLALIRITRRLRVPDRLPVHYAGGIIYLNRGSLAIDQAVFDDMLRRQLYRTHYEDAFVLDIGAHKGYFGAYALSQGAAVVVSFEPETENFDFLSQAAETFRRLGKKWHVHRAAVMGTSGAGILYTSEESWAHSLIADPTSATKTEKIDMVAFSDIIANAGDAHRIIVKLNAEGAECEIVMKTEHRTWARVDELFVQIHDFAPCTSDEVLERLRSYGLRVDHLLEAGRHPLYALKQDTPVAPR